MRTRVHRSALAIAVACRLHGSHTVTLPFALVLVYVPLGCGLFGSSRCGYAGYAVVAVHLGCYGCLHTIRGCVHTRCRSYAVRSADYQFLPAVPLHAVTTFGWFPLPHVPAAPYGYVRLPGLLRAVTGLRVTRITRYYTFSSVYAHCILQLPRLRLLRLPHAVGSTPRSGSARFCYLAAYCGCRTRYHLRSRWFSSFCAVGYFARFWFCLRAPPLLLLLPFAHHVYHVLRFWFGWFAAVGCCCGLHVYTRLRLPVYTRTHGSRTRCVYRSTTHLPHVPRSAFCVAATVGYHVAVCYGYGWFCHTRYGWLLHHGYGCSAVWLLYARLFYAAHFRLRFSSHLPRCLPRYACRFAVTPPLPATVAFWLPHFTAVRRVTLHAPVLPVRARLPWLRLHCYAHGYGFWVVGYLCRFILLPGCGYTVLLRWVPFCRLPFGSYIAAPHCRLFVIPHHTRHYAHLPRMPHTVYLTAVYTRTAVTLVLLPHGSAVTFGSLRLVAHACTRFATRTHVLAVHTAPAVHLRVGLGSQLYHAYGLLLLLRFLPRFAALVHVGLRFAVTRTACHHVTYAPVTYPCHGYPQFTHTFTHRAVRVVDYLRLYRVWMVTHYGWLPVCSFCRLGCCSTTFNRGCSHNARLDYGSAVTTPPHYIPCLYLHRFFTVLPPRYVRSAPLLLFPVTVRSACRVTFCLRWVLRAVTVTVLTTCATWFTRFVGWLRLPAIPAVYVPRSVGSCLPRACRLPRTAQFYARLRGSRLRFTHRGCYHHARHRAVAGYALYRFTHGSLITTGCRGSDIHRYRFTAVGYWIAACLRLVTVHRRTRLRLPHTATFTYQFTCRITYTRFPVVTLRWMQFTAFCPVVLLQLPFPVPFTHTYYALPALRSTLPALRLPTALPAHSVLVAIPLPRFTHAFGSAVPVPPRYRRLQLRITHYTTRLLVAVAVTATVIPYTFALACRTTLPAHVLVVTWLPRSTATRYGCGWVLVYGYVTPLPLRLRVRLQFHHRLPCYTRSFLPGWVVPVGLRLLRCPHTVPGYVPVLRLRVTYLATARWFVTHGWFCVHILLPACRVTCHTPALRFAVGYGYVTRTGCRTPTGWLPVTLRLGSRTPFTHGCTRLRSALPLHTACTRLPVHARLPPALRAAYHTTTPVAVGLPAVTRTHRLLHRLRSAVAFVCSHTRCTADTFWFPGSAGWLRFAHARARLPFVHFALRGYYTGCVTGLRAVPLRTVDSTFPGYVVPPRFLRFTRVLRLVTRLLHRAVGYCYTRLRSHGSLRLRCLHVATGWFPLPPFGCVRLVTAHLVILGCCCLVWLPLHTFHTLVTVLRLRYRLYRYLHGCIILPILVGYRVVHAFCHAVIPFPGCGYLYCMQLRFVLR